MLRSLCSTLPGRSSPLCSLGLLLALPLLGPVGTVPATLPLPPVTAPGGTPSQAAMLQAYRLPEQVAGGPYRITAERRALLNTIRYAEGTWIGGSPEGYRVLYGGGRFASLERHPEIEVRRMYTSAAAGAYQFLPDTWKEAAHKLKLADFGPASQDQAALYLVEKRGALEHFDRQGLSPEVLARLAAEWASLPTHQGTSYYGQPVKGTADLQGFFLAELARQRGSATDAA